MSDYRNILAGKDWVYTIVRPKPKHNKTICTEHWTE